MKPNPEHQKTIQLLASFARLTTLNLAIEHYSNKVLAQVPDELWQKIIGKSPTWFDFYFQTPVDAVKQMMASPSAVEAFKIESGASDPLGILEEITGRAISRAGETVSMAKGFLSADSPAFLAEGVKFSENDIRELALFKSLSADTRARATYGQSMLALVDAGKRGNDEGYFRAVTVDSTVQWHPVLIERISRDAMGGRNAFVTKLQAAAQEGPSKKIDKDLYQLRHMLSLLRDTNMLQKLSNAERYELFCHQLGLYPDTGENPKAAVCTFIKRWEASLV